jgi:fermentation-respiration switch protein FrsA (DUF1100 family)
MTLLKWLLIATVAGYGVLLAAMYVFQRSLMYFPDATRRPPAQDGLPQAREVSLQSADGEQLVAWFVPAREGKPLVIYFQGNAGGLDLRVERFRKLIADGSGLLALCYRGYGGSSGRPSEAGLMSDAAAAYDFARKQYPAKRIVLFGESLGTGIAVALAATHEIGGLVLDAPYSSALDVGAAAYPFIPVRWALKDTFRSDLRIAKVTAPVMMRHGARDTIVPIRFGERLYALANEPKCFARFAEGGHSDLDDHGGMEAVKEFLATLPMH